MTIKIDELVSEVARKVQENMQQTFEIEASGRHVHLSREHIDHLFGEGYQLSAEKYLSQPGQFAARERVTILGPKGALHNAVILGPARGDSQVEVSFTDALVLGAKVPLRLSGQIEGTPGVVLINGSKSVHLEKGLIVAKRHIHVNSRDAEKLNVTDQEVVKVKVMSQRPLIFDDVVVRINPKFETFMHIDYDEANACGFKKGTRGRIIKEE